MKTDVNKFECDQIGQFIGLWTTFQSLSQQLICPNHPNFKAILVEMSKSLIFLVTPFLATFIDIWQLFTRHTEITAKCFCSEMGQTQPPFVYFCSFHKTWRFFLVKLDSIFAFIFLR